MRPSLQSDRVLIEHMLESARFVQEVTQQGRDEFFNNRTLQLAVTYSLQILGEATKNLSAESKSSEPDMPWREIAGFRNKAAHPLVVSRTVRMAPAAARPQAQVMPYISKTSLAP